MTSTTASVGPDAVPINLSPTQKALNVADIIDCILEQLRDDSALAACTLLSRAWHLQAQPRLYRAPGLLPYIAAHRLCRTLTDRPEFGLHVRELVWRTDSREESEVRDQDWGWRENQEEMTYFTQDSRPLYAKLIRGCKNLQTLELYLNDAENLHPTQSFWKELDWPTSLNSFILSGPANPNSVPSLTLAQAIGCAREMPHLTAFRLSRAMTGSDLFMASHETVVELFTLPRLRSLRCDQYIGAKAILAMLEINSATSLQSLHLRGVVDQDHRWLSRILNLVGAQLLHLALPLVDFASFHSFFAQLSSLQILEAPLTDKFAVHMRLLSSLVDSPVASTLTTFCIYGPHFSRMHDNAAAAVMADKKIFPNFGLIRCEWPDGMAREDITVPGVRVEATASPPLLTGVASFLDLAMFGM